MVSNMKGNTNPAIDTVWNSLSLSLQQDVSYKEVYAATENISIRELIDHSILSLFAYECFKSILPMPDQSEQEAQLTLWVSDRTAPAPQSYKYNHAVRIWDVDAVSRQKIVIPSGIGLAAVLSWLVILCLSL